MLSNFIFAIGSVILISLLSLIGLLMLSLHEKVLDNILFYLVSFASGAILGAAYFDLIPEAVELIELDVALIYVIVGFVFFFLLERSIYWYHGHGHFHNGERVSISDDDERVGVKSYVYLNLIGDGVHNFIDGLVIGASFIISISAGIVTTLAVIFHELPQEIGDFAILVYGGVKRMKALMMNFITALTAIVGVVLAYLVFSSTQSLGFLVGFAGGGFTYIAAAELIPELQKEKRVSKSIVQFVMFLLAMFIVWSLGYIFHE